MSYKHVTPTEWEHEEETEALHAKRRLSMNRIRTDILKIAFEEGGPPDGIPVLLLHGWPDSPRGWNEVSRRLQAEGYRTIAPYLRGSTPTKFLSKNTPRVGAGVALAQDAMELTDALGIDNFAVLGHDWGAREAYILAALFPERVMAIAALALAYQPRGKFSVPSFDQSRRFWYQWFMCTDGERRRCAKILSASLDFSGRPGVQPAGSMTRSSHELPKASQAPIGQ